MTDSVLLLAAYDTQLRLDAEAQGALARRRIRWEADDAGVGLELMVAVFTGRSGFISTGPLGEDPARIREALAEPSVIAALVRFGLESVRELAGEEGLATLEWKTRSHDALPGLHEALLAEGFEAGEEESVMIGRAEALAVEVPLPEGITLRPVRTEADALALCLAAEEAFEGDPANAPRRAADLMARLANGTGVEAWMALADGSVVSGGRLEPVPGTDFAGIWGGFTLLPWRGQGIYRALTARRARTALESGVTLVNSDSTDYSRPILERYGFTRVTGTTPYELTF
ncbi:GNAT family N-acetyltransferase [Arthrobacter sp. YJM1]|uniref:GNAT family N-acetyltransferase n=3 Tax=Arthrobacter TaxID=1663 RepID=A0ABU9KRB7_9MICC|nr:GNAT family N-acetyltransferase [Arthrobacter sp. YJM1]